MKPRELELPDLLDALMNEHDVVRNLLKELSTLLFENKYLTVANKLEDLNSIINQHIIDEEGKILGFLLDKFGKEKSSQAISIFQQHREIHQLVKKLQEHVLLSREGSARIRDELENIMMRHFVAEESRIFPLVLETYRQSTNKKLL